MIRRLRDLFGWTIEAADGADIGTVENFYFDDTRWTVRYLVGNSGSWLVGRSVLVSPMAFKGLDWERQRIRTDLTRDTVKESPSADITRPISRQYEEAYSSYYGYPHYWSAGGLWGAAQTPVWMPRAAPGSEPLPVGPEDDPEDSHLRSIKEVSGYHIQATDGEIGHVDDFLVDDETWSIRYLLLDTSNWIGGRHVLLSPGWVRSVEWADQKIHVDMTREKVKDSPEYDPDKLDRDDEDRLYRHYDRSGYWES